MEKKEVKQMEKTIPDLPITQAKKPTNWKLISIVLAVIILSAGGVYAYQQVQQKAYDLGVQDASLFLYNNMASQLETQKYINFNYAINETLMRPLKLGVIQEQPR